jgi:anti-anti-sigma regulatory factor
VAGENEVTMTLRREGVPPPEPAAGEPSDQGGQLKIVPLVGRAGLRLAGELDLATRALFERELDAQLRIGSGDVHLELAELEFIDVGAVSLLATRAVGLGDGRRMLLHRPPPVMCRILDLFWGGVSEIEVEPT